MSVLSPLRAVFSARRRSLRLQVVAGFGLVLALVGVVGAISFAQLGRLADRGEGMVAKEVPYTNALYEVALAAKAAANDERGYLLKGEDKFLVEVDERFAKIDEYLAKAKAHAHEAEGEAHGEEAAHEGEGEAGELHELEEQLAAWRTGLKAEFELFKTDKEAARELALTTNRDLRKGYEKTLAAMLETESEHITESGEDFTKTGRDATRAMLIGFTLTVLVAAAAGLRLLRSVRARLRPLVKALHAVAEGDLSGSVTDPTNDEIGEMTRALDQTIANTRGTIGELVTTAGSLATSAQQLNVVSHQMSATLDSAAEQAESASAAAEQVSDAVNGAASAAEQLAASIREIAASASESTTVASGAVEMATQAQGTMGGLERSSAEIGDVLRVITSVAEQTHLLALNATIEAARAGAAGKGFAVVAGEVKELAHETGTASEDISRRIDAIQADARSALQAISEISEVIQRVNETQVVISSAVEEQSVTTGSIGQSVTEAAVSSQEIARNLAAVAAATSQTRTGAATTTTAAEEVARMATTLNELAAQFRLEKADA
jgi:methyl-accepting chemotaxis protein